LTQPIFTRPSLIFYLGILMFDEFEDDGFERRLMNEAQAWLENRSMLFLEAAVASMLDCLDLEEVARRLEEHAKHLREYG